MAAGTTGSGGAGEARMPGAAPAFPRAADPPSHRFVPVLGDRTGFTYR